MHSKLQLEMLSKQHQQQEELLHSQEVRELQISS